MQYPIETYAHADPLRKHIDIQMGTLIAIHNIIIMVHVYYNMHAALSVSDRKMAETKKFHCS
jgi:hypothetical protein